MKVIEIRQPNVREVITWKTYLLIAVLFAMMIIAAGCSGGVSMSFGAGGSIHDPKHPDLANVVRETPIMETSTGKSWQVGGLKTKGGE